MLRCCVTGGVGVGFETRDLDAGSGNRLDWDLNEWWECGGTGACAAISGGEPTVVVLFIHISMGSVCFRRGTLCSVSGNGKRESQS